LGKTFEYAKEKGFEAVSSTLVTSHYQNKEKIGEIGKMLEKEFGIKFLVPEKVSSELKTSGFYKQNYCGCCYSLVEAWIEKFGNRVYLALTRTDRVGEEDFIQQAVKLAAPLLYGGSVKVENIESILNVKACEGVLVGTASWNEKAFCEMIRIADTVKK
jgi:hypothetical protein